MSRLKSSLFFIISILSASCTTTGFGVHTIAENNSLPADESINHDFQPKENGSLRILTLNLAHGRNQAANQLLLRREDIEQNLHRISKVLKRVDADIVALQEADGPSGWSGNFDHVAWLAREAGYPWHYRASHAQSWLFNYGTAILSRVPVSEVLQHTFKPSPPTFNKGLLLSTVNWMPNSDNCPELTIDVISVHLDFSRQKVRQQQINEMTALLSGRNRPIIILGDFNSEWFADESVVKQLAQNGRLSVYMPEADNLQTYNSDYRYDWILISPDLVFASYQVLPDNLSDHRAIVAEITPGTTACTRTE